MEKNNNNQNTFNTETHYGRQLAEKLRKEIKDFSKMDPYEKFVLDNGWKYPTLKELKAAYNRLCRSVNGILLSEKEFLIESGLTKKEDIETAKKSYAILAELVRKGQIDAKKVYWYSHCTDCIRSPETIITYPCAPKEWLLNTCGTEISEDKALVYVCLEFGFEVCRVQLIGTPYYDASDSNFIRFDCGGYGWLAKDGELYQLFI